MKHNLNHRCRGLALLAVGIAAAPPVLAAHARDERTEPSGLGEEALGDNVLSVKLAGLEIVAPGEAELGLVSGGMAEMRAEEHHVLRRVGVEVGYERVLVPGWLEAELGVLIAPGTGGLTLPIDLVLKTPFEFSPSLEGFAGLGLATEWFEAGERETAYGGASQLGVYYWLCPHVGLAVEAEYNLLLHPETAHEFVLASGAAFRF